MNIPSVVVTTAAGNEKESKISLSIVRKHFAFAKYI